MLNIIRLRHLLVKEEYFDTKIPTLKISIDKLPNPTEVTREAFEIPCTGHRLTARNIFGKILLKRVFKRGNFSGPAALTNNGTILEIYPVREGGA